MPTVVGYEKYSFTPNGETEARNGVTFYLLVPVDERKGKGRKTLDRLSVSDEKYPKLLNISPEELVGKEISLLYDQYKKPAQITVLK